MGILRSVFDQSVNDVDASYKSLANVFSFMEVFLGIICSCLPAMPAFIRAIRTEGLGSLTTRWRSSSNIGSKPSSEHSESPNPGFMRPASKTGLLVPQLPDRPRADRGQAGSQATRT